MMSNGSAPRFSRIASTLCRSMCLLQPSATGMPRRCLPDGRMRSAPTKPRPRSAPPSLPAPDVSHRYRSAVNCRNSIRKLPDRNRLIADSACFRGITSAAMYRAGRRSTCGNIAGSISGNAADVAGATSAMIGRRADAESRAGARHVRRRRRRSASRQNCRIAARVSGRFPGNIRRHEREDRREAPRHPPHPSRGRHAAGQLGDHRAALGHGSRHQREDRPLPSARHGQGRSHGEPGPERAGDHPAGSGRAGQRPGLREGGHPFGQDRPDDLQDGLRSGQQDRARSC